VRLLLGDPDGVVRGAAVWALSRLDPTAFVEERVRRAPGEADPSVMVEWDVEIADAPSSR
jgi:epoxyqueuosine reductase